MTSSLPSPVFQENVPLAPFTSLGVGGPARFLVEAQSEAQVMDALEFADAHNLQVFVLGGGTNILVSDAGYSGLVIRIALRGIEMAAGGLVTSGAGEDWDPLVSRCVERNLAGLECLSGIPGTVGGTPVQNVGAYGQEVGEVIASVRVVDRKTRHVVVMNQEACGFAYRTSMFNTADRDRYVVLSVTYALRAAGEPRIAYPDLASSFAGRTGRPSLAEVRAAVLRIRESKSMVIRPGDPDSRSAGSFFKNPVGPHEMILHIEDAARRLGRLPASESMPRYAMLPAAWLIEHAGFAKGYTRGHAGLSSKHALALTNRGGATAQELLDLMREIQSAVHDAFGIDLIPEPVFVGFA
jgi:UDP-N-acetylmuramate dehydrogenase